MPIRYLGSSKRAKDMNKSKLIRSVKVHLGKVGHGIAFDVITAGVRQEDSWWHVPVVATRNGRDVPREITVNIFANIEDELERDEHVNVLFVPALADAESTGSRGG
jgi:hypothetical protein